MESRITLDSPRCSSNTGNVPEAACDSAQRLSTILCVDDDPDALALLRIILSSNGFAVFCAASAEEALQQLGRCPPDLIITDCEMPGMHGLEFCRALRANQATRHIPILLHTGTPLPQQSAFYEGIFLKPADFDALARDAQILLSRSHSGHSAHVKPPASG